jgi:hypothetical protein
MQDPSVQLRASQVNRRPESDDRARPLAPRAWFRARIDRDPRRSVLLLASLEFPVLFAVKVQPLQDRLAANATARVVAVAALALFPTFGVVWLLVHSRLLLWSGRLLGGRARPYELHAAYAWAQVPLVVTGAPLLIWLLLLIASDGRQTAAISILSGAASWIEVAVAVAALLGGFLWVKFLAEAQRFSSWRALLNHALAGAATVALAWIAIQSGVDPSRLFR